MFIDTANLEEIKLALKTGTVKGVTTNPTILKKVGKKREEQISDILSLGIKRLYVQTLGETAEEMFSDYKILKSIGEKHNTKLGIKVPLSIEGLEAVARIKQDDRNVSILGTAIYSADQGIMGAIAGCDLLAPYVNRMQNNSIDSIAEISKMREFIDSRGLDTQILAASFKNSNQVVDSLVNGAHTCTIPYEIMVQMMNKDVAINAIRVFNQDGKLTL